MDMFDSLLSQPQTAGVHPETLEMLARKAAQLYQQQGVPLNQAISQVLSAHPELNNEHIKRIVEFANNVTFQELFEKSQDKNIHFPVADPGVVLRDLKDGGSPSHDGKTLVGGNGDYLSNPKQSTSPELEGLFDNQFTAGMNGGDTQVKLASAEPGLHANPVDDLYDAHVRLQATRQKLAQAHEEFSMAYDDAAKDFYGAVKRELISPDGAGLGGVVGAMSKVANEDAVRTFAIPLINSLAEDGFGADFLNTSLEKRAGSFVNVDHPLIQSFAGMMKASYEMKRSRIALNEVDEHLEKTSGALTTAIKKSMDVKSPIPGGVRQRFPRK